MSRMDLDPKLSIESLSGGLKRRVMLAQALLSEPELLLLDEPTNHLDLNAILWLENFLANYRGSLLLVTHDRAFMQKVSQRIIELDRGNIFSYQCNYQNYLIRREQRLQSEDKANALFDKRLAQEERWIRQGVKARRTRNEGRVRALKAMRSQRLSRRKAQGTAKIAAITTTQTSDKVFEIQDLNFYYNNTPIIKDFSSLIMRGDKIGIVGHNGCGKTTLLNLILGKLQPCSGSIISGNQLQIAYFDQLRSELDNNLTVLDNLAHGRLSIEVAGKDKHVLSYLQDFLFSPTQAYTKVATLSGGERNRLLLAKLFSKPANVVVMDEPTNDLDVETLELLESLLVDYTGTLLVISHDREFLNNVVTSLYVYEGDGKFNEYIGGYDDYLVQRQPPPAATITTTKKDHVEPTPKRNKQPKLSYHEQRELEQLPAKLESLEQQIAKLHEQMSSSEFYQQSKDQLITFQQHLKQLEQELAIAYARWEELE